MQIAFTMLSTKSGKSFILQIEAKKYIFNIFEGFQRYCIEQKINIASFDYIFLTSKYNIIPFIGMYLTLGDLHKSKIGLVSSFDLDFYNIHSFAVHPDFKIKFLQKHQDEYISVVNFDISGTSNYIIEMPVISGSLKPELIPKSIPKTMYKAIATSETIEVEGISYDCQNLRHPSIRLNKICLIFSEDNLDPIKTFCADVKLFFCFTLQSLEFVLKNFIATPNLSLPEGVYFVKDNDFVEYKHFYQHQAILNEFNKNYLIPYAREKDEDCIFPDNVKILNSGDEFVYKKSQGFLLNVAEHILPVPNMNIYSHPCLEFLGTGCAIPSKLRNVSSILYQNGESAVLLDAGEDTLSQILRIHGNSEILKKVRIIYLSHGHADHMLGLASILRKCRQKVTIIGPDVIQSYLRYFGFTISETVKTEGLIFISTAEAKAKEKIFYSGTSAESDCIVNLKIDYFDIKICGCKHSADSTSISISDLSKKIKFSYSGDTLPSKLFAKISEGVDVMVHEATFNDDQAEHAARTNHSRKCEAIEIFKDSGAKKLFLTHFSNRNTNEKEEDICVSDFYRHEFTHE